MTLLKRYPVLALLDPTLLASLGLGGDAVTLHYRFGKSSDGEPIDLSLAAPHITPHACRQLLAKHWPLMEPGDLYEVRVGSGVECAYVGIKPRGVTEYVARSLAKSDDFAELVADFSQQLVVVGSHLELNESSVFDSLNYKMLELEQRGALKLFEPGRLTVRAFCACCAVEAMATATSGKQTLNVGAKDVVLKTTNIIRYEELAARLSVIEGLPIALSLADLIICPPTLRHTMPWYTVLCAIESAVMTRLLREIEGREMDRLLAANALYWRDRRRDKSPPA